MKGNSINRVSESAFVTGDLFFKLLFNIMPNRGQSTAFHFHTDRDEAASWPLRANRSLQHVAERFMNVANEHGLDPFDLSFSKEALNVVDCPAIWARKLSLGDRLSRDRPAIRNNVSDLEILRFAIFVRAFASKE